MVELLTLAAVAFATSILSAIIGMAGGITLLAVMLLFFDPLIAIPLHGVVQLVSNSSRVVIHRPHLRWDLIWRYGVLLLPMGFVGVEISQQLPPAFTKGLIGVFVLAATWAPKLLLLGAHPEDSDPKRRFLLLGGAVGVLNTTIGATGPLIAPFFLNLGLTRFALIGTKAGCQVLGHLAKLVIFGVVGFAYLEYAPLLVALCLSVVVGTLVGSKLLNRVNERWFVRLYKTVLTVIAIYLVVGEIAR
ncbi:MAG: sulfite exporter TauE/SafE family protein [Myxococcales bacterium]|nr:sulfite exporter TauE/SafE family protein [Myxococcales bacterium]